KLIVGKAGQLFPLPVYLTNKGIQVFKIALRFAAENSGQGFVNKIKHGKVVLVRNRACRQAECHWLNTMYAKGGSAKLRCASPSFFQFFRKMMEKNVPNGQALSIHNEKSPLLGGPYSKIEFTVWILLQTIKTARQLP